MDSSPTMNELFRQPCTAEGEYLAVAHWLAFRPRAGRRQRVPSSSPPEADGRRRNFTASTQNHNEKCASKEAFHEVSVVFRPNEQILQSYGEPLATNDGSVLLPVLLSGTGGPNPARRCEERARRFARSDRKDIETRTGIAESHLMATDSAAQECRAPTQIPALRLEFRGRTHFARRIPEWMAGQTGSRVRTAETSPGLASP